ncbi:RraA family protein [Pantoea sp. DY-15]|uniref:RraA family protein n=1 Tax=Pantoea sp. DY-15 TaxID=2871489 RepID=UPI001C9595B7|nr:RraA family protein [Pantoea sp. DY-15]MBY4890563.1 RraA family protein [Pantoea sp. DY-15]
MLQVKKLLLAVPERFAMTLLIMINQEHFFYFIDDIQARDVVVIDNSGRQDCTVWGGNLSKIAVLKDIACTLINAIYRDTKKANEVNYPLYAIDNFIRTGKYFIEVVAVSEPISINGTINKNGHLIADVDGVVVIPDQHIGKTFESCILMKMKL